MTFDRQIVFWLAGVVIFAGLIFLLSDILLPFVAGMAIAYFLDPLADRLEAIKLPRLLAVTIIVTLFALLFITFLLIVATILLRQVSAFASGLPGYIEQLSALARSSGPDWLKKLLETATSPDTMSAGDIAAKGATWLGSVLSRLWSGGKAFVNILSLLIVTPIVAFYMLYDWDRMIAIIDNWLPRDHVDTIRDLARKIDAAMSGFVRGQVSVCLILGAFYAVGLTLAGLNQGALIGLSAGFLSFIPYVGTIVGLVLSMGVAIVQWWPATTPILIVAGVFIAGQFLEGNILSPKLVGGKVGLHPVWLMFALFAFGLLFGFVGLLIAVPTAAAIGVLARFAIRQYMNSELYHGVGKRGIAKPASGSKKRPPQRRK